MRVSDLRRQFMSRACQSSRLVLAAALAALVTAAWAQDAPQTAADRARTKIDAIVAGGERAVSARSATTRTLLTEAEINDYLRVHGSDVLPSAITRPELRLGDDNRVRVRAIVDLDEVRRSRPRDWRDPLAYVAGAAEVIASGRMISDEGFARAELDSATIAGLSIPKSVVQELLRFFTSTPDNSAGFAVDEPFALPANTRRVDVRQGHVVVVH